MSDMSLDLHLSFSLSPPPPTPTPSPGPVSYESQEPPNKRRKLNTLKSEKINNYPNSDTNNTNTNTIKDEILSNPPRKKRVLPSLVCNKPLTTKRSRRKNTKHRQVKQQKNRNTNISHRQRRITTQNRNNSNNKQCEIKPEIYHNSSNNSKWNTIAITSLTTIFEYINLKFLYVNASKVCKYWYSTICGTNSDFIFGFFRKTMHLNPMQPLTLIQLKSYNVSYIKQELKARKLKLKGKKSELIQRLYQSIQNDSLIQNVNHKKCIMNRKRLILFQMKQLFKNDLFCQNCHKNWSAYFTLNKKSLSKKDIMKRLTCIHMGLNICRKCQSLQEFQDVNMECALKYYGLNQNDFIKCNIILRHGKAQMAHFTSAINDEYTNAYVCEQIAKMKYSNDFKRRSIYDEKKLANKARGLLQKGENDKYNQIYAPDMDYNIDKSRFEFDEILYNATLTV